MTTSFSSLPIIDVGALKTQSPSQGELENLSKQLYAVFSTTGFAYLKNLPLTFDHEEIFNLSKEFFALPVAEKMKLAKTSFRPKNENTYRG
jgi:isopenicillin N synthase-like dioxygenase